MPVRRDGQPVVRLDPRCPPTHCEPEGGRATTMLDWLATGIAAGYCSDTFCTTHDGPPLTDEEADDYDTWEDGCVPAVRLWDP